MNVVNNKKLFRFEILLEDGDYATLQYRWLKGNMVLMHTLVPKSSQRKGIGSHLVKAVLEYAKTHDLKIIVYCAFAAKYIHEHPEYQSLRAQL